HEAAARERRAQSRGRHYDSRRSDESRAAGLRRAPRGVGFTGSEALSAVATRSLHLSQDPRSLQAAPAADSTARPAAGRRVLSDVGRMLLVAAAYFLTAQASMQFSGLPAHISFIWLPAGISLAALLLG